ncbi:PREDICTED: interferon type B-like [Calidris pugnax]|uniref:interferon type B-like n=1 Tax=Calidris pugnax TaxID=198806 RepID=UPI00071C7EE6|nr:PREDICTED: interferon type B-like [Calidris pugnax]
MPAPATLHRCLWHGTSMILLLLTALTTTLSCQHMRPQDATFAWDSLKILKAMAPTPSQPCQHYQPLFPFPDTLLHTNQPQQAAAIARHILQNLLAILSSHSIPQHWDAKARHDLLNNLYHYSHHLEQCMSAKRTLTKKQGPRNVVLSINKYFKRIQDFLHTHSHSACAWDHVRFEARASFQRVDTLIRQMKSRATPAPP